MKGEFTSMKLRRVTMRWFSSHKGRIMAERKHRMSDDEALFEILGRLERTEKSFAGAARASHVFKNRQTFAIVTLDWQFDDIAQRI